MNDALVVHLCFVVLGACCIFPWLSFITAVDYFQFAYGSSIETLFAVAYNAALIAVTVWVLLCTKSTSVVPRTNSGIIGLILLMLVVPIADALMNHNVIRRSTGETLTLVALFGCGAATAVLQNTLYGLAAVFGRQGRYTVALGSGMGAAEVIVVAIRVLTKLSGGADPSKTVMTTATMVYFVASILFLCCGLVVFLVMQHTSMGQGVLLRQYGVVTPPPPKRGPLSLLRRIRGTSNGSPDDEGWEVQSEVGTTNIGTPLLRSPGSTPNASMGGHYASLDASLQSHCTPPRSSSRRARGSTPLHSSLNASYSREPSAVEQHADHTLGQLSPSPVKRNPLSPPATPPGDNVNPMAVSPPTVDNSDLNSFDGGGVAGGGVSTGSRATPKTPRARKVGVVWRRVNGLCVSVFLIYVVCLACFPGVATRMPTYSYDPGKWIPVGIIGLYNVGDFLGKAIPNYPPLRIARTRTIYSLVLAHAVVYLPLFVLGLHPRLLPPVCHAPWYALSLSTMLGISAGYLGASTMALAPQLVDTEPEKEIAGMLSSLGLILGLFVGSWVGVAAVAAT